MTREPIEVQDKKTDFEKAKFHAHGVFRNSLRFIGSKDRNNYEFQPWGGNIKIKVRLIRDEDQHQIEFVEVRAGKSRYAIDVRPVRIHMGLNKDESERTIYVPYYELPYFWKSLEKEYASD